MLVKSLDFPHLNYCGSVTKDMTVELSDIDVSRITVSVFVFDLKRRDRVMPFYNELFILRLNPIRKCILLHTVITDLSPVHLSERVVFISHITFCSTKQVDSYLTINWKIAHYLIKQLYSIFISKLFYIMRWYWQHNMNRHPYIFI